MLSWNNILQEKLQEKNREVALLHTKNENMKKILEDEEAETGIKKLKKRHVDGE